MEVALASMSYAASRAVLSTLSEAIVAVRRDERDLGREIQLEAALALAHLSRGGDEVAEIYEHRAHVLAGRMADTPAVALWANAVVALVIGDVERSAEAFASLSARFAVAPDDADERLRFEVLAGLGDARWRQGDSIGARAVLTEAMAIGSQDRRRLARCHEILAELHRRDHRLDAAFSHLQTTRLLEDGFRPRAAILATERRATGAVDGDLGRARGRRLDPGRR